MAQFGASNLPALNPNTNIPSFSLAVASRITPSGAAASGTSSGTSSGTKGSDIFKEPNSSNDFAKALFIQPSALPMINPPPGKKFVNLNYEICMAMCNIPGVNQDAIDGCMKINNLWRLSFKGPDAKLTRALVLSSGLNFAGHTVPVLGENPFLVNGEETAKLVIRNLSKSISMDALKTALIKEGFQFGNAQIRWDLVRDYEGKLTTFKNGNRFVYIAPPSKPVPE